MNLINMKITLTNKLTLEGVHSPLEVELMDRLTLDNPRWIENDRMGRWNGKTPRLLKFYEKAVDGSLIIPRGFARQVLFMCKRHNVKYQLIDKRRTLPEVDFKFLGQLRPFQLEAVKAIAKRDFGTLASPTGSGKTIMALFLIAERKQPALVVCHTRELQDQWVNRIGIFLGIPAREVGRIGGGKRIIGGKITVALVQSLYKIAGEVAPYISHLVIDEAHRCPSRTFTEAVTAFDSKYMLGLSATPWRRDKLSKLIFSHLGDVVYEIKKDALIDTGDVLRADVIVRETNFESGHDPSKEYSKMLSELTEDPDRNTLIACDVAREAANGGGICLVLSDRRVHCQTIRKMLVDRGVNAELLTGDLSNKQRQRIVEVLNDGKVKILCATGQLIGEGFDCKELSTLFLATPIKFSGRLLQYLGRVLRPAAGKEKARVFDYIDVNVGVLKASAKARQRVYAS